MLDCLGESWCLSAQGSVPPSPGLVVLVCSSGDGFTVAVFACANPQSVVMSLACMLSPSVHGMRGLYMKTRW